MRMLVEDSDNPFSKFASCCISFIPLFIVRHETPVILDILLIPPLVRINA